MALGIENSISDTAKAFQGNPAALQQRYAQKQDLFDLLALNMIRKEQDAAKRGLLLSQKQMPGTILEQMEGAVTKNATDMAKGVKGVLDTKNAQSKENMSKMAGVSGAPAPNMAKMADGGIVGFAAGKEVESKDAPSLLDDAFYMLKTLGTGLQKKELEAIQDKEGDTGLIRLLKGFGRNINMLHPYNLAKVVTDPVAEATTEFATKPIYSSGKDGSGINEKLIEEQKRMQQGQLSGLASLQKPDVKPSVGDEKKPVVPVDNFAGDKSGGVTAAPAFDASKFAADGAFNQKVKGGIKDLIDSDPQKAVDFAARTPEEQAFISKMLQERTDMRKNMMDPDKLSEDKLMQTLLGAKGATAGEAFRTSGLAGINAQRAQDKLQRDEFDALNKLYMTEADRSQSIKQKAFEGSQADKKQGVASGTSLTTSEKNAALEADKLVATISNNAVQSSLKKDLNDIQKQRNNILQSGNVITGNTKMVQLYENAEATTIKTLTAAATKAKGSNLGSDKAEKDKAIDAKLAADIKKLRETIQLKAAPFRDALKQATTNASAKTGGMTEVDKILGIK